MYIVDIYVAQRIYVVSVLIYADVIHLNICDIIHVLFYILNLNILLYEVKMMIVKKTMFVLSVSHRLYLRSLLQGG